MLRALKIKFGVGLIRLENETTGSLMYAVTDRKDLKNVIIPFLDANPLVTSKALDYQSFRNALLKCEDSSATREDIEATKARMNSNRSFEERWTYSEQNSTPNRITIG
jgi:hypothetical protein